MNRNYDVIVIGGGFAGLSAAIEAKRRGKQVIVLEKMANVGGNSIISDGGIAAPNTKLQEKYKIEDSVDLMKTDIMKAGDFINNDILVDHLVTHAKEAFEWTKDYLGVQYLDRVDIFGGHSIPRCYTPLSRTGRDLIRALKQKCEELDVLISTKTKAEYFLRNNKDELIGVHINIYESYKQRDKGRHYNLYSKDGLILTSGGYGQNQTMLKEYAPSYTNLDSTNKPTTTNQLLEQLQGTNVLMVDLDKIQLLPATSSDEAGYGDGPLFGDYIVFPYGILVDSNTHERFVNELSNRKHIADEMVKHPPYSYGVADQKAVDFAGWDLSKNIHKGIVKRCETLKELARYIGSSVSHLRNVLHQYNTDVTNKIDQSYKKEITNQQPIDTPPFYVMRMFPKIHHTMGGLVINKTAQVLDRNDQPIKGLYAAGEVVGGLHGAARLGSVAVADCIVFGRTAGKNI